MRRFVARLGGLCLAMLLAGCGSSDTTDFHQFFQMMRLGWRGATGNSKVALKEAAAIPYASMGWRWNGGNQNIIVLATDNNGDRIWTSAAHVVLETQDGRVKRTVGLGHDLTLLTPQHESQLVPPAQALRGPYAETRLADFASRGAYNVTINCRGRVAGTQFIVILGKRMHVTRVEEDCSAASLNWSFKDRYWISADDGFVWRSFQHLHPAGDTLETEVFRPPG